MRYLNLGTVDPATSQAVYHAVAHAAQKGDPATLITVKPNAPYVCVGYHQAASREVDRAYCEARGILVGRRMVGGGAVWLDSGQVFWHLVLPGFQGSPEALYRRFLPVPVAVYRAIGIAAEYRPVNDLVVGPRKIGGTGAAVIGGATVLVGSLLFDFDIRAMSRVLRVPSEKFRDKMVSSLEEYMTTIRRELGAQAPPEALVVRRLVEAFAALLAEPVVPDVLNPRESALLAHYRRRLFAPEFVYQGEGWQQPGVKIREGVRLLEGVHKAPGGLVRVIWRERDGRIDQFWLTGDFFADPPEGLEALSHAMAGVAVERGPLHAALETGFQAVRIAGVSPEDVLAAMQSATALTV